MLKHRNSYLHIYMHMYIIYINDSPKPFGYQHISAQVLGCLLPKAALSFSDMFLPVFRHTNLGGSHAAPSADAASRSQEAVQWFQRHEFA